MGGGELWIARVLRHPFSWLLKKPGHSGILPVGVGEEWFSRILGSCCFHFSWGWRLKNLLEKHSVVFDPEGVFHLKFLCLLCSFIYCYYCININNNWRLTNALKIFKSANCYGILIHPRLPLSVFSNNNCFFFTPFFHLFYSFFIIIITQWATNHRI